MFSRARFVWTVLVVGVAVALSAQPAAAQGSVVTITVPPIQRLEGATSLTVSATVPRQLDRLVVKSNTPWVLVAHVSGVADDVSWRIVGQMTWQQLGAATPVLQGLKGVHPVQYELKMDPRKLPNGLPVLVTFSVEPLGAH